VAGKLDVREVRRGQSWHRRITVQTKAGIGVSLAGSTLHLTIARFWEDDEVLLEASLGDGIVDVDLTIGRFDIALTGTQTLQLEQSDFEGWVWKLSAWPGDDPDQSWDLFQGRWQVVG
jgi:hypothetical protein